MQRGHLQMLKDYKKSKEGFTIIEVLIVLAIAGLIMLIVLLAVPALTRSTRNSNRREDAGRIVSAINEYISNTNGTLPDPGGWASEGAAILSDAGTLAQYKDIASYPTASAGSLTALKFDLETGPVTTNTSGISGDALVLEEASSCTGGSGAGTISMIPGAGSTPNAAVLLYDIETTGKYTWACATVQ